MTEENDVVSVTQEQIDAQVLLSENDILLADMMIKLEGMEEFQMLFQKRFIDDWSITNTMNMANADPQVRARIHEKMVARGHFCDFCESIKIDGELARENLQAYREAQAQDELDDNSEEYN